MKPHKRNGKVAKTRRQESASDRATINEQFFATYNDMTPDERLIVSIFGAHEECMECGNQKLVNADCMTPHCKALREGTTEWEASDFYDEVTEDHVTIKGATMHAGIDY